MIEISENLSIPDSYDAKTTEKQTPWYISLGYFSNKANPLWVPITFFH